MIVRKYTFQCSYQHILVQVHQGGAEEDEIEKRTRYIVLYCETIPCIFHLKWS